MNQPNIIDFYLNGGETNEGVTFDQMIAATDEDLERSHTWVQWLFPLNEASAHNRHAPVMGAEEIAALSSEAGQAQFIRAFNRFMKFFGMISFVQSEKVLVWQDDLTGKHNDHEDECVDNFAIRSNWLTKNNHNLKRITRIIRCAKLLGLMTYAKGACDGFSFLSESHPCIDARTLQYWSDAVNLPFDAVLNTSLSGKVFRI